MKRFIFIVSLLIVLICGIGVINVSAADNGLVVVDGVTLKYDANGNLQGFVDISLSNVNITGFTFKLNFDNNYLVPSDFNTNEPTQSIYAASQENIEPFEDNLKSSGRVFNFDLSKVLDSEAKIDIVPDAGLKSSGYITDTYVYLPVSKKVKSITVGDESLKLLTLSFKIVDIDKFLELDKAGLERVLNVSAPIISIYVDSNKVERFGTLDVALNLNPDLSVIPTTYSVTGTVTGWNMSQPFVLEFYRTDELEEAYAKLEEAEKKGTLDKLDIDVEPMYIFKSNEVDEKGNLLYGSEMEQASYDGQCSWTFNVPVLKDYDYRLVVRKLSHLTYSSIPVNKPKGKEMVVHIANPEYPDAPDTPVRLFVGDVNGDEMIYLIDRSEIEHFYQRSISWDYDSEDFQRVDLNGDNSVNFLDVDLLKSNYGAVYEFPKS